MSPVQKGQDWEDEPHPSEFQGYHQGREAGSARIVKSVSNCNGMVEGVGVVAGFYSKTIEVCLVCLGGIEFSLRGLVAEAAAQHSHNQPQWWHWPIIIRLIEFKPPALKRPFRRQIQRECTTLAPELAEKYNLFEKVMVGMATLPNGPVRVLHYRHNGLT
jgi:hypothetical protein